MKALSPTIGTLRRPPLLLFIIMIYLCFTVIISYVFTPQFGDQDALLATSPGRQWIALYFPFQAEVAALGDAVLRLSSLTSCGSAVVMLLQHRHKVRSPAVLRSDQCTRPIDAFYPAFEAPGPLVVASVVGSGSSGVMDEISLTLPALRFCRDSDAALNSVYIATPESIYLDGLLQNNTLRRAVRYLPNTVPHWRTIYDDLCRGVGSSVDCAAGCSPLQDSSSLRRYQARPPSERSPHFEPMNSCPGLSIPASSSSSSSSSSLSVLPKGEEFRHAGVPWALKGPFSLFYISFYAALFGQKWKLLHVVRDGRDIAYSDKHELFDRLCPFMYSDAECEHALQVPSAGASATAKASPKSSDPPAATPGSEEEEAAAAFAAEEEAAAAEEERRRRRAPLVLEWWGDVNTQAYRWAHAHLASSSSSLSSASSTSRYMVIRVEDLVGSSTDNVTEAVTLARLLHFVGVTPQNRDAWLRDLHAEASSRSPASVTGELCQRTSDNKNDNRRALFRRHGLGSYPFHGNKLTPDLKKARVAALGSSGAVALRHFGYDPDSWGLARATQGGSPKAADWLEHSAFGTHGSVAFERNPLRDWYIDLTLGSFLKCPQRTPPHVAPQKTHRAKNTTPTSLSPRTAPKKAAIAAAAAATATATTDAPATAAEGRRRLSDFGDKFGGHGGAPCHRSDEFLRPGPLIIGGVGDSGTSAIVSLVQSSLSIGVCGDYGGSVDALYMLKPETVWPDKLSGNNTLNNSMVAHSPWTLRGGGERFDAPHTANEDTWSHAYRDVCGAIGTTIDCLSGCSILRTQFSGSVRTMRRKFKLVADRPTFPPEPKCASQYSNGNDARVGTGDKGRLWGWKGPRSIYFLPFYQAVFGDHFRFLHVMRDGRDVAYGDNQMQFWMLCEKHYSPAFCDRSEVDHHVASMQFWQDVNLQAYHLATGLGGTAGLGLGRRYMVLRVEDLARPQDFAGTLARLLDFAGGDAPAESHDLLNQAAGIIDNLELQGLGSQSLSAHMARLKRGKNAKGHCESRLRPQPYEGSKYPGGNPGAGGLKGQKNGGGRRHLQGREPKQSARDILRTIGSTGRFGLEHFGYTGDTWGRYKDPPGRVWELPARRALVNLIGVCGFDVPYRSDYVPNAEPPHSLRTYADGGSDASASTITGLREEDSAAATEPLHMSSFADDEVNVLEDAPEDISENLEQQAAKSPHIDRHRQHSQRIAATLFDRVHPPAVSAANQAQGTHQTTRVDDAWQMERSLREQTPSELIMATSTASLDTESPLSVEGIDDTVRSFATDCRLLRRTFKFSSFCDGPSLNVYPILITGVGRSATKYMADSLTRLGVQVSHDNSEVGRHGAVAWPLALRETGHLDPNDHSDGDMAGHGVNGYELPSFLHDHARSVVGSLPRARFEVVFHQVREPLKCIVSRANRIGMMYSPIAYGNWKLFSLLLRDILKIPGIEWSHPALRLLAPPTATEQATYDATRRESSWTTNKRLTVALYHFVYWSAFIDLFADWTYRIEDTMPYEVCTRIKRLGSTCEEVAGKGMAGTESKSGKNAVSKKTNSHDIIPELVDTSWKYLCAIAPNMTLRALELSRRYGYVAPQQGGSGGCGLL